jgi:hypothetical protein
MTWPRLELDRTRNSKREIAGTARQGKGRKAVPRLPAVSAALEKWPDQEFSPLWWNVRNACGYIRGHTQYLVNDGARSRKGLPFSSSIAKSAINQVVSLRMAKKRHTRGSDEGPMHWR